MDTPLWTLDLPALEAGYHLDETRKAYVCLCCGKLYPQQEAFPVDGRLLLAEAAVAQHVAQAHGGMLDWLLSLDKKLLALTENQRQLLRLLSQGKSDAAIAAALDLSASTVRHQRFTFREKAKQAKLYLAAYELAMQGAKPTGTSWTSAPARPPATTVPSSPKRRSAARCTAPLFPWSP